MPWFEPLTDTQVVNLSRLRHTCRQAEDALTQGIDKLEQTLAQNVAINITESINYDTHMKSMIEGLEALENFSNQVYIARQLGLLFTRGCSREMGSISKQVSGLNRLGWPQTLYIFIFFLKIINAIIMMKINNNITI